MRKIIVSEFMTLDRVDQGGPGAPREDPSGGFTQVGWQMPFRDEVGGEFVGKGIEEAGEFLLGRVTYDIFAGYRPNQPADDEFAKTMNEKPTYVVSNHADGAAVVGELDVDLRRCGGLDPPPEGRGRRRTSWSSAAASSCRRSSAGSWSTSSS
jgi:hypothetical protein